MMRRIRRHPIRALVDWAQALSAQALSNPLAAHRQALAAKGLHNPGATVTAATATVNLPDLGIQNGIGLGARTGRTTPPLAVACAGNPKHPAQPAHAVVVAVGVDPGVFNRDPFAKYAVAFRRISTSSLALASSLRRRLFSASRSVGDRRTGPLGADSIDSLPGALRLRRDQLLNVAIGMPSRRAAS